MVEGGTKSSSWSIYAHGKLVFRLKFSSIDSSYRYLLSISQAETERILRELLARQGVATEWVVTFIAFAQADRDGMSPTSMNNSKFVEIILDPIKWK
jgi:hypothetical protein